MDDDSLDELVDRSPGPDGHRRLSPAALASNAEESSDGTSEGSEDDTGSERSYSTDGEDQSGSEDSEEGGRGEEDMEALVAVVDTQGKLEDNGAFNSDDDAESCPICLNTFRDQAVGTPENCAHYFCLDCIVEWSKNANSCPVDRTIFKCICIRARFGGKILKKIPVENARAGEEEEEDPTFCEVCGRSDREDRLLLCDGCDAGYHMECLDPPLQEVPVDEWFCPECAAPGAAADADAGPVSEEEVALLLADVVPTTSRLRPHAGRTRAIARTRQSERVRATVNRNRISTARRIQHVPRYLMSSLLDETIEAVAAGLSTAVYQRPVTPRAPKRRRRTGRRKKASGRRKAQPRSSVKSRSSGARSKKRQGRVKKRKGNKSKNEATARSRIARTLGLRGPACGGCIPSVHKPAEPSLGLMRADIGAASLSLFGDPYELDPFDSSEDQSTNPASPLSAKRRVLSQSALRSHRPVARPVAMGLSRRSVPAAAPEPEVDEAPVPDLVGSILSGQSLLMMNGADIIIHRDGSLSAKRAAPVSFPRSAGKSTGGSSQGGKHPGPRACLQPRAPCAGSGLQSMGLSCRSGPAPSRVPVLSTGATVKLDSSVTPPSSQAQNPSGVRGPGLKQRDDPRCDGDRPTLPASATPSKISGSCSHLPPAGALLGQALKPAPRRPDISELPRIPKVRREDCGGRRSDAAPTSEQRVEIPSSCISRLTGREGPGQPGHGARAEGEPSSRGPQEPRPHSGGGSQSPASLGPSKGKGVSSTFESFRINIPGNTAHSGRLSNPGFCNTFRPVDNKVQRKENPSPLFSIRKTKQLKSEIYDPFDPTGSDSSSAGSSPERLGSGLLPSEITRTISINSPKAPTLQTVRCVTSYTVETVFGAEPEPPRRPSSGVLELRGEGAPEEASDLKREGLGQGAAEGRGSASRAQRPSPSEPWEDKDQLPCSTFFGSEERTVTCVTVAEPEAPPSPDAPQTTTHRIVELRSPSCSRSTSSSRGRKKAKRKRASAREHRRTRSGSHSGSRSGDRSSRSVSPPVGEDHPKRQQTKSRGRRSSSDHSSSHERAKRKKAKEEGRRRKRDSWGHGRRRSRSRSGSPGSSSHERRESRRRKRRRSGSRSRGRECSPASSLDRARRHRHPRERSRERPRIRWGSHERRKRRSRSPRSPSTEHRSREHQRPRSHEKRPRPRSPERKLAAAPQEEQKPDREQPARPPASVGADASPAGAETHKVAVEVPAECPPEDLDYGDSVEAGHIFEDFSSEVFLMQLDDMSSPPSPESTDSSPERDFPPNPAVPPASQQQDASLAVAVIRREVSLIHGEDAAQPPPQAQGPDEKPLLQQDAAGAGSVPSALGSQAVGGVPVGKEEGPSQTPLLRAKALVKRVTWNLQDAESSAPAEDRGLRTPLHRPQKPREGVWEAEDMGPSVGFQQTSFSEPPPPGYALPESGFPDAEPSQVYTSNLPPAPALPVSLPPYAPASQPTVQFILQGSLPLASCGVAQSPAPVPTSLATASEPAGHSTGASNSEERTAAPRPAAEKAKNEEYMKKLHMQERAVEEVKLAIKPFYQKREVTKDEYKDILRKAVQKICHSKSGEINPVKVGNLVKAYVDKYRHMRRHRRAEAGEEAPAQGPES
ncbi:PHD and RING finger domain-containing protein 1 isoform X1 [Canis lupus dingo]|uniref:PHD and RING finger domain-containing protein 1 n=2 Tax=Canis lupus TaxID=9612 RepID=A0A8I3NQX8_CANLF|nr:PHD and RING finger domain-containing protein 1 isoform X1 [Canis lupus dingo]XP_038279954.1 PHD and RING finger domain-containing protein 1 isoform X1 [Canis lupus familiaris]XP_038279955.1 PHD and RING finger domain-containing protein 1 isoform X1 [Canis lupus familiaris]XP_038279956.1 PHD and RING finger domain-containing protein 1 isoform X1 [Canis lupus familiaris]XP_048952268.1 PHD and RING finger domain-containing protein 1 isoform X1 [Canis lupus dingo]